MATGQAAGTIGEIAELLGDERGLLRRPSRPSKGKGGKSSSNGPMMNSKDPAASSVSCYSSCEDPWAMGPDPWAPLKSSSGGRGGGGGRQTPPENDPWAPLKSSSGGGGDSASRMQSPTEVGGDSGHGSGSTRQSTTEASPESLIEKLSRFLLAKPNQLSQRKEVLLASCERGHKLVDDIQLTTSIVEEAFKLARRRLQPQSPAAAAPEIAAEADIEPTNPSGAPEERKDWGSAGSKWWQHDDRWGESNWWETHSWDNTTSQSTWQPDNKGEEAAAIPVSDDELKADDQLPDQQLVDRLVLYLKQKDLQKGMAVLRSCASGVPRPAAEAAIARVADAARKENQKGMQMRAQTNHTQR